MIIKYLLVLLLLLIPAKYAVKPVEAIKVPLEVRKALLAPKQGKEGYIWNGYAELKNICSCESWGDPHKEPRQFKDGKVLRGFPNPNDVGACQINTPTWQSEAEKLGYDIFTYQGNIRFAKWLYNHQGNKPWLWSKQCWND